MCGVRVRGVCRYTGVSVLPCVRLFIYVLIFCLLGGYRGGRYSCADSMRYPALLARDPVVQLGGYSRVENFPGGYSPNIFLSAVISPLIGCGVSSQIVYKSGQMSVCPRFSFPSLSCILSRVVSFFRSICLLYFVLLFFLVFLFAVVVLFILLHVGVSLTHLLMCSHIPYLSLSTPRLN